MPTDSNTPMRYLYPQLVLALPFEFRSLSNTVKGRGASRAVNCRAASAQPTLISSLCLIRRDLCRERVECTVQLDGYCKGEKMTDGCWSTGGAVGEGRDSFLHPERYGVYWKGSRLEFHPAARDAYAGDTSHFRGMESKEQERMRNWTTANAVYGSLSPRRFGSNTITQMLL
eukprot:649681-Pyramimonas_sp.AAC.1